MVMPLEFIMDMDIHIKREPDLISLENYENLSNLVINKIVNNRLLLFLWSLAALFLHSELKWKNGAKNHVCIMDAYDDYLKCETQWFWNFFLTLQRLLCCSVWKKNSKYVLSTIAQFIRSTKVIKCNAKVSVALKVRFAMLK